MAQAQYVKVLTYGSPPKKLTKELDSGELEQTRDGTVFRFCIPNDAEIELELVQLDGEWRVDFVMAGRKEFIRDGVDISPPCRIK